MITVVVVVVLLMRGRFGLGCRRRRRLRSLIALRRRRIKYHAVELNRLLGVSLVWRDEHTKGKGQDRKTHHRISSDFLPSDFRHSALAQQPSISERKARIVSVKLGLNLSNGGDRPQRVVVTIRDPRRYIFQWRGHPFAVYKRTIQQVETIRFAIRNTPVPTGNFILLVSSRESPNARSR
jgi:hypothetical protein